MKRFTMFISIVCMIYTCALQAKVYANKDNIQLVNYQKQRDSQIRPTDRNQPSKSTHSYMYVNPFFEDYYSNYYDTDGTQFYFFYQKDDPTYSSDDIPSNYNNNTDFSTTDNKE
ncbi:MAG: hypothetical protein AB7V32_09020 [Candidatus Berkiella sp.]